MKLLDQLLEGVEKSKVTGQEQLMVEHIAMDSREVRPGGMFIAVKGTRSDGHTFIDNAIQNGARVIVCETLPDPLPAGITFVKVKQAAKALGTIAHHFYDDPTDHLELVGVTGTNGKTTVATLLYHLMEDIMNEKAGLISTVEYRIGDTIFPSTHTTPDPVALNRMLAQMVETGCKYAFMEVSSHAIDQDRVHGLKFAGGIFTNISHDHLDYHGDFLTYINVKKRFFDELSPDAFAVINADDPRGDFMIQNCRAKVSKYSLHKLADFKAKVLANEITGLHLRIDDIEMHSRLVGEFNASNLLAAYGAAVCLGLERHQAITALSALGPVAGRFDIISHPVSGVHAIVDYAHTPDALEKVLKTLRAIVQSPAKLIAVAGCGGDRDKTKRPLMGRIAATLSDLAILTSDNPRSENPEHILDMMMEGVESKDRSHVYRITDRREAIRSAVRMAKKGDTILIAGKGHEAYQEIQGVKYPFDDKKVVHDALFEDI
jgi:UDP-N-acetylmuramoyl-L-alanyl-D-glutamate--2,6-diaminopimelate ligase